MLDTTPSNPPLSGRRRRSLQNDMFVFDSSAQITSDMVPIKRYSFINTTLNCSDACYDSKALCHSFVFDENKQPNCFIYPPFTKCHPPGTTVLTTGIYVRNTNGKFDCICFVSLLIYKNIET